MSNWSRLVHLGGDDYVLDHIVVDPENAKHIYVAAWNSSSQQLGEVFRTRDGGRNWEALPAMHGKSIRGLAMYKGDAKVLVAGALDGVFRTKDGGDSWERLSPAGSGEIKAGKLESKQVKVSIAGSGDVTVWAKDSLHVSVAG